MITLSVASSACWTAHPKVSGDASPAVLLTTNVEGSRRSSSSSKPGLNRPRTRTHLAAPLRLDFPFHQRLPDCHLLQLMASLTGWRPNVRPLIVFHAGAGAAGPWLLPDGRRPGLLWKPICRERYSVNLSQPVTPQDRPARPSSYHPARSPAAPGSDDRDRLAEALRAGIMSMVKARPLAVPPAGRRHRPSPRGHEIPEVGCLVLGVTPPILARSRCGLKEFGAQLRQESDAEVTGFTGANDLSIDPPGFRDPFEQHTESAGCDQPTRADQAAAGTDVEELCRHQPLLLCIHDQHVCSRSPRGRPRRAASLNCDCHGGSVPPVRTKLEMIEDLRSRP